MKYIPIFRLKSVENTLLSNEINNTENLTPLLEITDNETFEESISNLCKKFNKIMVELPLYLSTRPNKHQSGVLDIINEYESTEGDSQVAFYKDYQKDKKMNLLKEDYLDLGFTPVISTIPSNTTYSDFLKKYNDLKDSFNEIAFRLFVYSTEITDAQKENIQNIVNSIRDTDFILLDVLGFENVEVRTRNNLEEIIKLFDKNEIYILNAFDYDGGKNTHNYSPLLSKELKTTGFGDFATIPRIEAGGGGGAQTKKIRFYNYNTNNLMHFIHETSFQGAIPQLEQSEYWKELKDDEENHLAICSYCNSIEQKTYNYSQSWWKKYRIMHYINSIMNHTIPNMSKYDNSEDFDPDGYNDIVKKIGTIS